MKRLLLIVSFFFFLTSMHFSFTQDSEVGTYLGSQDFVSSDQEIHHNYTKLGNNIEIFGKIYGNAYIAGGHVRIEGEVHGDLYVAGGMVVITGKVSKNAYIMGGHVTITGDVGGDLTLVSGNVDLTESSRVDGQVFISSGHVHQAGLIGGDVLVRGGRLTCSNEVRGNLDVVAASIHLTSNAKIHGNVDYFGQYTLSSEAQLMGKVNKKVNIEQLWTPLGRTYQTLETIYSLSSLISFFSTLVIGVLSFFFFPAVMNRTSQILSKTPWMSLVTGVLTTICCLLLIFIFFLTVVGFRIALILTALLMIAYYASHIFVINWIGKKALQYCNKNLQNGWTFFIGLVLFSLAAAIPFLGVVLTHLVIITGFGSLILDRIANSNGES